jgi:ADP-ribosyl-[dinitrogen reductase] hydrolase
MIEIAEIAVPGLTGMIGLAPCPGRDRDLVVDLAAIRDWGAAIIVTLVEHHELETMFIADLPQVVARQGIGWLHLPVRDMCAPDAAFDSRWQSEGAGLRKRLQRGERVLVHCRGGRGRAGTVAARLLIELGMPAEAAIAQVRAARPGAIETSAQLDHLHGLFER